LEKEIDQYIVLQCQLHQSYAELHSYAKELGIILMGDLPFYIAMQSPLVWAHQEAFQLQHDGDMRYVSGVPNTPHSHYGRQLWGHPLYNWEDKEKKNIVVEFWKVRLRYQSELFDLIRFDHAKAFFLYGVLDTKNENNDTYKEGPGTEVFEDLIQFSAQCGLSIFAEDTGHHIEALQEDLLKIHIPGIKLFRFAYDERTQKTHDVFADIQDYPHNTVVYSTTHDTETLLGYLTKLKPEEKQILANAAHVMYEPDDKLFAKNIRDALIASPANTVIIPIQDWLLTTDRINVPGTEVPVNDPNWHYQLSMPIEDLPKKW
jgi:4-alpha-glucanotransferase